MRFGLGLVIAVFVASVWADAPLHQAPSLKVDGTPQTCGDKAVVGPTVFVTVEETGTMYLARTDTGSESVSLNAWGLVVEQLALVYQRHRKVVNVSLNDRSHMDYPMLLGRDWLDGNFVVDVSLPEYRPQ
ncbi:RimK/LysX family protein [Sansalvadorimonas sp. 2012CJ34-2]|uniref:RimK/LysX family protein n=1 Tax=Parendozoicomonas callyspongiae TaxID=2942213 RepID=A0ABT0PAK8_9GAMM|nr:RimK/LysX family protein [Sansalvadorimonas sp. 2012CJ34-2]MCL6268427.1 RimK/LysX family protein [Sansalvadorimonas sp. 2012CJ34-2]